MEILGKLIIYMNTIKSHVCNLSDLFIIIIIQHIDTLPKYGHKTLDVRRST